MDPSAGLDIAQRTAVSATGRYVAVVATAGSGKTRVLTRRVAHRVLTDGVDPARVLVLTFTRRAAGELGVRLAGLGLRERVAAGTFHAVALAELRRHRADRGRPPPVVLARRGRLVAAVLAGSRTRPPVATVVRELEWAKARGILPEAYPAAAVAAGRPLADRADEVAGWYAGYERERRRRGLVDFDDLVVELATVLGTDPAFAAARRWWWRHLHVDEYQDVTPAQLRLLRAWLGTTGDLFVVGDDDQSIYGFAGARPGMLAQVADDFPGATVVTLRTNHRSTAPLVAAGAAVVGRDPPHCTRGDGPEPVWCGHPDAEAEAEVVVASLRAHRLRGRRWSDLAVLARTHARLEPVVRAMAAAGIPHVTAASTGGPLDQAPVRAVLDELRVRAGVCRGLPFEALLADLGRPEAAPDSAGAGVPRAEVLGGGDAAASVATLAREYLDLERGRPTLDGFEAHLATLRTEDTGAGADVVTVSTFHRAKGLEWDVVHVVGLEAALLPLPGAPADEEARVLHVAMTRAAQVLAGSWAGPTGPTTLLAPVLAATVPDTAGIDGTARRSGGDSAAPSPASLAVAALATARSELATARSRADRRVAHRSRRGGLLVTPRDAR